MRFEPDCVSCSGYDDEVPMVSLKSVKVGVGVMGGGLMGREAASAFGRWFMLEGAGQALPLPQLVGVADISEKALQWFESVPGVGQRTKDYRELLDNPAVEVVYVAVPHD